MVILYVSFFSFFVNKKVGIPLSLVVVPLLSVYRRIKTVLECMWLSFVGTKSLSLSDN